MADLTFGWSRAELGAVVTRHGGDPLGLRAWANLVARDLTPGITNVTSRVQGYALFCAGIQIAGQAAATHVASASHLVSADEAFRRFDALWVHAQTRHLAKGVTEDRWPGSRAAERVATEDTVDLSIGLLTQPLASGIFGAYRRSAMRFGLARPPLPGGAIRPASVQLTKTGQHLADLCIQSLWQNQPADKTPLLKMLRQGEATRDDLANVRPDKRPRPAESQLMNAAIAIIDDPTKEGLHALRTRYNRNHDMSAVLSSQGGMTPTQEEARRSASVILRLVDEVEQPYRSWLVGDEVRPPSSALWDDQSIWATAEADGATDALTLRDWARASAGWDGVHRWQHALAGLRGGDPLDRYRVPTAYGSAEPPAFGLHAAGSLFSDGLLGRGSK